MARRQLVAAGLSDHAIKHRLSTGRLHRIARGIYAVGRPSIDQRGRWMAAVLSCGPRAVLSHASAAALWGFGAGIEGPIEISVPIASPRRRPGVRVNRRPQLAPEDVTEHDDIPVTRPVRTLIDLAARYEQGKVERAINEADRLSLTNPEALLALLDHYPGQRGVGVLREMLGKRSFRLTDSELERRFLRLVADVSLPIPLTRQRVNGFRVDFYWPDLKLVVETDGLRYHRTPAQQTRDRLRDQAHTVAGFTHLRFAHAQIRFESDYVRRVLLVTARRLGCRPGRSAA